MTTIDSWTLMQTSIMSGSSSTSASSPSSRAGPSTQSVKPCAPSPPAQSSLLPAIKPFKCPKPNCVKSFTQANGLNHHLAYGSCKFEPPHEVRRETPNDLIVQRPGQSRIPRLKRSDGPIPTLGSSQVGTFFQASNNVRIPGAQFTSARDVITINYHQHPEKTLQDFTDDDPTKISPLEINSVSPSSFKPTSPEIYTRQLSVTGRGYPLWIPEPNNKLPVEYQKKGIGIGDVGIITHYGAFDFLFNICVPLKDPINPSKMPENFSPLSPPLDPWDVRGYAAFKSSSHLASANVKTSQSDKGSIMSFRSSASEGAILTMPNGSNAEDLRNIPRFKKYASANAMKWYKYLRLVCGDEAENGDLRLVVGYDKANAWGMATFHGSSRENAFLLEFKPIDEKNFGRTYGWDYSGTAEVKSGPDLNEMEKLRILDQADSPVAYENQCLFVQTINVTLQADAWDRLVAEPEEINHGDDETERENPKHGSESRHSSSNLDNPTGGLGNRQRTSGGPSDDTSIRSIDTSQSVQLSSSPRAPNTHPSRKINELLLKNNPNATIALTEDKDWMSVIEKDDTELPPPEVLYSRIVAKHHICEEQGTIFIQLKDLDSGTEDALLQSDVSIQPSSTPISGDHSLKMSPQSVEHLVKPSGGMIEGTPVEIWIVQTQTDSQNPTAIQVKQDADTSHLEAKPINEPMAPGDDLTRVLLSPSTTFEGNTIEEKEGEAKKQEVRREDEERKSAEAEEPEREADDEMLPQLRIRSVDELWKKNLKAKHQVEAAEKVEIEVSEYAKEAKTNEEETRKLQEKPMTVIEETKRTLQTEAKKAVEDGEEKQKQRFRLEEKVRKTFPGIREKDLALLVREEEVQEARQKEAGVPIRILPNSPKWGRTFGGESDHNLLPSHHPVASSSSTTTRSQRVREAWKDFEQTVATSKNVLQHKISAANDKADEKYHKTSTPERTSLADHEEIKNRIANKFREEHYEKLKGMWARKLANAGLRAEDWIDMTPEEMEAITTNLNGGLDTNSEDLVVVNNPVPHVSASASLSPPQPFIHPHFYQRPIAPSTRATNVSSASISTISTASSYALVHPTKFHSGEEEEEDIGDLAMVELEWPGDTRHWQDQETIQPSFQPTTSSLISQRRRSSAANTRPAGPPPNLPFLSLPPASHDSPDNLTRGTRSSSFLRPSASPNLSAVAAFSQARQASSSQAPMSSSLDDLSDPPPQSYLPPSSFRPSFRHRDPYPPSDRSLLVPPSDHPHRSEQRPSSRRALTRALELAREAVQLDSTNDNPEAAVNAYARSVALLGDVMERVRNGEDSTTDSHRRRRRRSVAAQEEEVRRLQNIHDTYADRMNILSIIYSIPPVPYPITSSYSNSNPSISVDTQSSGSPTTSTSPSSDTSPQIPQQVYTPYIPDEPPITNFNFNIQYGDTLDSVYRLDESVLTGSAISGQ